MMNRRTTASRLLKTGVSLSLLLFTVAIQGCVGKDDDLSSEHEKITLTVRAAEAAHRDITERLRFSGTTDAFRRVSVAPASPGQIERIFVDEGQNVRHGQLLVKMDDRQLQAAGANLRQLRSEYERVKILKERGSATQQAYEQIESGYAAAMANYSLLQASVEIRAPYAGTIIGRHFNEGEIYSGMPGAAGSAAIVELAQLGKMKIEIMVPERGFIHLTPGQVASIKTTAYPDTVFEGKVHTVNPALNRMSRTSRVIVAIDNADHLLKPGMFAQVSIDINSKKNVLTVPSASLVRRNGETLVFTVESGETPFTTRPVPMSVTTGLVTEEFAEIVSGLNSGAVVLIENNVSLVEATDIQVVSIDMINKE